MGKTESFEFLNELALAFRAAENHPRPQCAPVLEGVRAVLAHLQSTDRLVPAGGMALTVHAMEDMRRLVNSDELKASHEVVRRLRALFPATEPAAVRDGSDLVVVQRSHAAKAVQSWMTLDLWTDLGKNDKDFDAEYERQGFGDLWATLLGEVRALVQATTPAPAKPAEKPARRCDAVSISGDRCFKTFDHDDDHKVFNYTWDSTYPAPAEPAEEETKAESHIEKSVRKGALAKLLEGVLEADDDGWHLPNGWFPTDLAEAIVYTTASSPVAPAPTETGPWQRIDDVPVGVPFIHERRTQLVKLADGKFAHILTFRFTAETLADLAPFVAAEEG